MFAFPMVKSACRVKVVPVRVLKEKGIASIAANNDVIKRTREMNTWFTWHIEISPQNV